MDYLMECLKSSDNTVYLIPKAAGKHYLSGDVYTMLEWVAEKVLSAFGHMMESHFRNQSH